jgi:hypothetical protein
MKISRLSDYRLSDLSPDFETCDTYTNLQEITDDHKPLMPMAFFQIKG